MLSFLMASGSFLTGIGSFGMDNVAAKTVKIETTESSFEDDVVLATGRGGAQVSVVETQAKTGNKALLCSGRTANWNGAAFSLSKYAGTRVKISCWVKAGSDAPTLKVSADEGDKWPQIALKANENPDEWTFLEGEYFVASSISNPNFYVELPDSLADFYVDDIKIEMLEAVKEPPALGKEVIVDSGLEDDEEVWVGLGDATVAVDDKEFTEGSKSLKVTARKAATDGAMQDLTGYVKAGSMYAFSAKVKSAKADTYKISLVNGEKGTVVGLGAVKAGEWTTISGLYTVPTDADMSSVKILLHSEKETADFNVDEISMIEQKTLDKDGVAKKIGCSNPIVDTTYAADPYAIEYDGRVYVYATNDNEQFRFEAKDDQGFAINSNGYGKITSISVYSSADMVNWTCHGDIPVAGRQADWAPDGIAKWAGNSWAPAACHKTIDGKEKFFLYFADNGSGIGVLEADSPIGPFREPETGSRLIAPGTDLAKGVVWLFDPAVLVDDDGTGYLYYGGGVDGVDQNLPKTSRVVKLADNMVETEGDAVVIEAPSIFEDSGIHKYNNKYYYTYCSNFSNSLASTGQGNICVMEADSPMGPFKEANYQGIILENMAKFFGVGGNNHHCVFSFKDKWYITYHAQTLGKAAGKANGYRSVHIDPIAYDENGHIKNTTATYEGVGQLENLNPYQRIEAETFAWQSGVTTAKCAEKGTLVESENMKLTNVVNNTWTALSGVDFGTKGSGTFTASVASTTGSNIEVYVDNMDKAPAATLAVPATGSADTFKEVSCDLKGIKGVHNIFFVFKGNDAKDSMEIDYWKFTESTDAEKPPVQPVKTVKLNYSKIDLGVNKSTTAVKAAKGDKIKSAKSASTKIATVSVKSGVLKITGKKTGTTKVTVTTVKGVATLTVNVKKSVPTTKLSVNTKNITLKKGKKATIKATVAPVTSTDKVTFKTSNKKVATVSSSGVVLAKGKGSAKITVQSGKKKVTVNVKVK